MKNIFKSILVTIIILGGFSSCSDSDLAIDTLYEEVNTTGSVLRILETSTKDVLDIVVLRIFTVFIIKTSI